ncbi:MAG: hypothetical protein FJ215_05935 [Ignavibacteria bacterium]|nr:hypothetical protein [Ignavibacteria bacterium]
MKTSTSLTLCILLTGALTFTSESQPLETSSRSWIIRPALSNEPEKIPTIVPHSHAKRPKVALVLSGGGARGIAAIGVLKSLERNEIPIDLIVGTSMGSTVGGLYASGYSIEQLEALVDSTRWDDLLAFGEETRRRDLFLDQKIADDRSILVLRFDRFQPILPEAISTGQRLTDYLNILSLQGLYHPNPSFDDLRIPFRAVATDLVTGRRVVIDRGSLAMAMRASMTVPLLFSSVKRDTLQLLDGGLVANVPVDVARERGADVVIAVDVTSPLRPVAKLNAPWEIADQITSIMTQATNQSQLDRADVVIRPPLTDRISSDFSDLDSLIIVGEKSADAVMPQLHAILSKRQERMFQQSLTGGEFRNSRFSFNRSVVGEQHAAWIDYLTLLRPTDEAMVRHIVSTLHASGQFAEVYAQIVEDPDSTLVVLRANPHPVLRSVSFEGNRIIPPDSILRPFLPLLGKPINAHDCLDAMEQLLGMYRDRGLSLARIRGTHFNHDTEHATIYLEEGTIHRRTIQGTRRTRDYVIWRELPFKQGDVFQVAKIAEGMRNIYSTNLFEQVAMSVQQESDSARSQALIIDVRERYTGLMRFGLRIDNERNLQPSIDMREENFLGIGSEVGLRFFGGLRNRTYSAEFRVPRIFNSYLTFTLRGYYSIHDVNVFENEPIGKPNRWNRVRIGEFREEREGVLAVFGTQLERLGSVTIQGRYENQNVWSIFGTPIPDQHFRFFTLKFGTTIDTQDRYPFPRDGILMNFSYEYPLFRRKSGIGYTKLSFNYESFQSPLQRHTIRPRLFFGFADETLPITEQFSLGGQDLFLGLREDDSRGRQVLVGSLEYRYFLPFKIFFDSYVKLRYDIGAIWGTPEEIRLKDLRHGIGGGLSLDTPIGPVEMSVGQSFYLQKELLEHPLSFGPVVVYFSIGYSF